MRDFTKGMFLLALPAWIWGCALTPPPQREYFVETEPVLSEGTETYYVDPIDSSVVWSQEGVQVKVKFFNDKMLDAVYNPRYSPYTLTGVEIAGMDYTPPAWTVFEITVINRTRERVEFDPTQAILRLDNGRKFYCREGVGVWRDPTEFFSYEYLKWSGRDGNSQYFANFDRNDIWRKSQYQREKPVRKGSKYSGKIAFPPLPSEVKEFTLEVNDFILAFDRFEVGYGNPVEFTDLAFRFTVDQGVRVVEKE